MLKQTISDEKTIETPKNQKNKFFISKNVTKRSHTSRNKRSVWSQSATSMTRDCSPAFRIPLTPRFSSVEKDIRENQHFLQLNLRQQMDKGVTFAKSRRTSYFIHKEKSLYPSSASYNPYFNKCTFQMENPELQEKLQLIGINLKNFSPSNAEVYIGKTKGVTFKKFEKDHKLFHHHGRNMPYQPQITSSNPGIGAYSITPDKTKPKSSSYTFRLILERFNEHDNMNPGPGAYKIKYQKPHRNQSINQKGTLENSGRIFLQDADNKTPGVGSYTIDV